MPVTFTSEFDCADAIITRVGKQLRAELGSVMSS
jgi:hypothetical protein